MYSSLPCYKPFNVKSGFIRGLAYLERDNLVTVSVVERGVTSGGSGPIRGATTVNDTKTMS